MRLLDKLRLVFAVQMMGLLLAASAASGQGTTSTFKDGSWFPTLPEFDPDQNSSIWTNGLPGANDTANVLHTVGVRNDSSNVLPDGATSAEVNGLNLLPGGDLFIAHGLTLNVDGISTWTGGILNTFTSGGGTLGQRGVLTIAGGNPLLNRAHVENTDQIILQADLLINTGSVLDNMSSVAPDPSVAVIELQGEADLLWGGGGAGQAAALNNFGVVRKTGNGESIIGALFNQRGTSPNNQAGTVEVLAGQLSLVAGGYNNGGHYMVADGAALEFGGTTTHHLTTGENQSIYTGTGAGTIRLVDGATISGNQPGNSGVSTDVRAILDFAPGLLHFEGGTITGGTLRNDGEVNLNPTTQVDFRGRFLNQGTILHHGDGSIGLRNEALINDTAGLYELTGDGDITDIQNSVFTNRGTFRKSGGTLSTSQISVSTFHNEGGSIEVNEGRLRFAGRVVSSGGTYHVADGGELEIANSFQLNSDTGQTFFHTGTGDGIVRLVDGGTLSANAGGVSNDIRAVIDFAPELLHFEGGQLTGGTLRNDGQVNLNPVTQVDFRGRFLNQGTILHHGDGSIGLRNEALINDTAGLYELTGDGDITNIQNSNVVNLGTLRKSGGGGTSLVGTMPVNQGIVDVQVGTLQFTRTLTSDGDIHVADGATLRGSTSIRVAAGGTLGGSGTVDVTTLRLDGIVSPGDSTGTLSVDGNYEQNATGVIESELGGTTPDTGYDQLVISGTATLDGLVVATFVESFTPDEGDFFDVLTATGGVTGRFAKHFVPALPDGLLWTAGYGGTTVTLSVVAETLPGDFDLSGGVDGDDFLAWQSGFGVFADGGALSADGDADLDGDVDGDDFLLWQSNFGSVAGNGAAAVPEPGACALLLLPLIARFGVRRKVKCGQATRR